MSHKIITLPRGTTSEGAPGFTARCECGCNAITGGGWPSRTDAREAVQQQITDALGTTDAVASPGSWADVEELSSTNTVSYYNLTLSLINGRIRNSGRTRKDIAAAAGMSADKLRRKLNGETMLMVSDIGRLSEALGCRMSDLVA